MASTVLPNGDYLTEILHKTLSYHPETRITLARYHSGLIHAYTSVWSSPTECQSQTDIPLTDDLHAIEWDFGYQVHFDEDGSRGYRYYPFREERERKRLP